jgi:RNA polymerase sigma-70 factor (ECF subfamily)
MARLEPTELGRLFRSHAPALRLFARQWGDGADDLVQIAFVRLAQQTVPPGQPLPWLYRVVRNEALSLNRAAARRRQREQRSSSSEVWFGKAEDQLESDEAVRALAALSLEFREVIVARLWGGLTFEEIAELVGCSPPTAHRRYWSGLKELRTRLEGPCKQSTPTT